MESSSPLKVVNKLRHPAVIPVVFLAVGDEDVVIISGDEAGHINCSL